MLFDLRMVRNTHDNDNEPLTFQSLGLAAALVINRIRIAQQLLELASEQKEGGEENPESENQAKDRPGHYSEDVERGLHELAASNRKQKGGNF